MYGLIFGELKKYVDANMGGDAWARILKAAGLGARFYLPIQEYPDAEAVAIVSAAAELSGQHVQEVLEDFGAFIAPDLLQLYRHIVDPSWRTLDVIEKTEETIHTVVRLKKPGAQPPELKAKRRGPDEVVLIYASPRRMCSVAVGIALGLGRHYGEEIVVSQPACMLRGAAACTIVVRRVGSSVSPNGA